ncbi:MAG: SBBP repeat-containing protein, partial [Candidatus Aminicenantes bacterium]|nr:SBBP repeat-containing protein [Candidatus Aminicenantes bacterium]
MQTPAGGFFDDTPVAWQEIAGKRESVALKYAIEKGKSSKDTGDAPLVTYGFTVGEYNPKQTLILDPVIIVYCGYIGGSGEDLCYGITVDSSGCAYMTGATTSTQVSFPDTAGPDLTYNGDYDAFVAKVKTDGTGIDYCGYIGGSDRDEAVGVAVDSFGCAYITGNTKSTENTFPVAGGPDLTYNGGIHDSFVAKVNSAGTGLVYCGYIGGSGQDVNSGIVVDGSGYAYVTGSTGSSETTFPVTGGPDLTYNGGVYDSFVAKINPAGTGLVYCGYIGGSGNDEGQRIAIDGSGNVYIVGFTGSAEDTFPVSVGPDITYNGGMYDAFVAKVKDDGTGLDYCGYIGGSGRDECHAIDVNASGCIYVTGITDSNEATFPVAVGPDITYNGGIYDAFVVKVKADGTALDYCGYIGGSNIDDGKGIKVDASGCVYITGVTGSTETSFPVTVGPDMTYNGGSYDVFVAKLKTDGTTLDYCGYIGGSNNDLIYDIAVDASSYVYVSGWTGSTEATFPVTVGPDLTYNGGGCDAFIAKISLNYTVNFAAGNGGSLTGTTTQTVEYGNNCTAVEAVPNDGYNFVNWTGTNGFITTTDNPLTVANVTADMMITANFIHSNPAGWIPLEDFQNNMIVYGKAYNGNNPAAVGDWIGAFGPGGTSDCRGITAVQANGNYYLTIGSNETSGETITFKLWPLPSGPAIDGSESITFIDNAVYDGLPLHFGPRGQNFALVNGWNWISFNTLPDDTSFNSVFGTPGVIEQIKSQNQAAIYTGGTWIGDLTDMSGIANGIMYKVKTNQAYAFNVTGMTVPYNTPLSLITGWNWTAYLPTLSQPVADAVNSIITPVSQVKSQTQSVIKIGSVLFGDLTEMAPNKGYTILMNQPGVLQY